MRQVGLLLALAVLLVARPALAEPPIDEAKRAEMLDIGVRLFRAHKPLTASAGFHRLLDEDPSDDRALYWQARTLEELGFRHAALAHLLMVVEGRAELSERALLHAARLSRALGDREPLWTLVREWPEVNLPLEALDLLRLGRVDEVPPQTVYEWAKGCMDIDQMPCCEVVLHAALAGVEETPGEMWWAPRCAREVPRQGGEEAALLEAFQDDLPGWRAEVQALLDAHPEDADLWQAWPGSLSKGLATEVAQHVPLLVSQQALDEERALLALAKPEWREYLEQPITEILDQREADLRQRGGAQLRQALVDYQGELERLGEVAVVLRRGADCR